MARPSRAAPLPRIKLDDQTRDILSRLLTGHLKDELGLEVGAFEGLALVDFVTETLGPYIYNQGLYDAQAVLQGRLETVVEAIGEIEKPTRRR